MKTNSLSSDVKVFVTACGLLLLLLTAGASSALAQTNTFPASGNAGIGTTSPPNPLTIARSGSAPYTTRPAYELLQLIDRTDNSPQILFGSAFNGMMLRYTGTDGTATNQRLGIFTGGAGEAFVVNNNGYVGIGTTAPSTKLEVVGNINAKLAIDAPATTDVRHIFNGASAWLGQDATNGELNFGYNLYYNAGFKYRVAAPAANIRMYQGAFQFQTAAAGSAGGAITWADRMAILANGNVGIGTTSPAKKLDVAGDINASGQITGGTIVAKYQDVAEWVESSQALTSGTVVVLDQTKSNQVIASSHAYDTRVAGVISLQPGITLGENGPGKVLVATTGRVRIKVDASGSPIQIGDLLVTGDKEGVAKKSEPLSLGGEPIHRPGTLIGKALEPLAKGTGEILVLLSLQ